jgi:hypothetical protein
MRSQILGSTIPVCAQYLLRHRWLWLPTLLFLLINFHYRDNQWALSRIPGKKEFENRLLASCALTRVTSSPNYCLVLVRRCIANRVRSSE